MGPGDRLVVVALLLFAAAGGSLVHLHATQAGALTVYTTPALRDLLENGLAPTWRDEGGMRIEAVYVAAGQQYNRLRMSGSAPEADVFLHASPLYIEKGADEGYFLPFSLPPGEVDPLFQGDANATDGVYWTAFAWSPVVTVYHPDRIIPPDLARSRLEYGLPHPTLSNNGVYAALFLDAFGNDTARHARAQTTVQPVNARTNILGVADGSFDVTLGYEAVARFFQEQGATIAFDAPLVDGERATTPALFSVGLVAGPHQEEARRFAEFLFREDVQRRLDDHHFRSVYNITAPPSDAADHVRMIQFDWTDWRAVEATLARYEVVRGD